ncbi:amidophosphoribosyltransferase [Telmatospirillum sp. J64-1]|uniref:amidophosphoribosyltransferase n=1 Tax=Telmatospirillum sp. J64-1 TaxID=2502183 RepID=UPI00115D60F7|nr:amidophosphoribosyltransferase [Telmatospirillum sp. J64-1]
MLTTNPFDDDKMREECGVFGIFGHHDSAAHAALGLHALQHRGQEAAGIVSCDGEHFHNHRGLGHVADNFGTESVIKRLKGSMAIGHVRYSTSGETMLRNVQPLFGDFEFGGLAIAHNGNLTNAVTLRKSLVRRGCLFQSTTDTETIIHLIAISLYSTVEDRLIDALRQVEGAYSLVAMTKDMVLGVRDPLGIRPLVLGKLGESWIMASESVALDIIGADFVRDVEPGEMVILTKEGVRSVKPFPPQKRRFCIFEYIYFARPDSVADGTSVYEVRKRIGAELARESAVEADVVIPVPDSGVPAALGYAGEAGIPFELGIIRNHYVGRTFIQPTDNIRHLGVKLKHNANRAYVAGKRVILVDDSIVRGTTSKRIVEMVRAAGATEVHMRISSPPTVNPCFYGIDTPEQNKLLAAAYDTEGMAKLIGVDSLAFISIDGLYRAVGREEGRDPADPQFCDACFTGEYPVRLTDQEEGNSKAAVTVMTAGGN